MKILTNIKNIFAIDELKDRILYTIGFILIFRLGSYIMLPGLDYKLVHGGGDVEGLFGLIDNFLGGAFSNKAIFGLGIMPYITASIVIQLLQVAVPYFQRLQKEGESGTKKINQMTRVLTLVVCTFQSIGYITAYVNPAEILIDNKILFQVSSVIILTTGTFFCVWLGDKITEKGIGNGISMLIMIGILSRLPASFIAEVLDKKVEGLLFVALELAVLYFIFMGVVLITQATRHIPVSYAKQVVGNKVYGGQRNYIPMKVNAAGVMPIIFAQSLMFLPSLLLGQFQNDENTNQTILYLQKTFSSPANFGYMMFLGILILLFTYFYTAMTINPNKIADDLKRNGGFVPGIKPGQPTADYIDNVLSKITLPGAIYTALIAILPGVAMIFGVGGKFAQFFGGTSLLIMVGVVIDTISQIKSYLQMSHYDGMMKTGKLKGKSSSLAVA
jgi:preprotein translocase subunit SecY